MNEFAPPRAFDVMTVAQLMSLLIRQPFASILAASGTSLPYGLGRLLEVLQGPIAFQAPSTSRSSSARRRRYIAQPYRYRLICPRQHCRAARLFRVVSYGPSDEGSCLLPFYNTAHRLSRLLNKLRCLQIRDVTLRVNESLRPGPPSVSRKAPPRPILEHFSGFRHLTVK